MIALRKLGTLTVAAASGIVADEENVYIVADDDLGLLIADRSCKELARVALLPGSLPSEHRARKRAKPDFESLASFPGARLLALPSGSLESRSRGALFHRDDRTVTALDLAPLYARLAEELSPLNLEGAAVIADSLFLLQRGNGEGAVNALVELDLALASARSVWGPELLRRIVPVELGTHRGVALTFTDASPHRDRLVFTAAAEDTKSTYEDGACLGSVLGVLDLHGRVVFMDVLDCDTKIEGVHVEEGAALLVADADDPSVMSPLFSARLPAGW